MFNLLSTGGSRHDLDLESGAAEMASPSTTVDPNLDPFFRQVQKIKSDMDKVKSLLSSLQSRTEESKGVTKALAMKELRERMEGDVKAILRETKLIKSELETLDAENLANRKLPGCEQGSTTDRTRMAITNGLRNNLRELMQEFQGLRKSMVSEHRETVGRRYYAITGQKADEEILDKMIETGESERFLQKAIQEQGRGNIIEAIKEIQERHDAVVEMERSLRELHQIFMDMAVLVEEQGEQLNNIEATVMGASSFVRKGTDKLQSARKLQKNSRKCMCIGIILLLIILIVVLVPILVKFIPTSSNGSSSGSSSSSSTTTPSPPPPPPPSR